jgi:hypothetical protein
MSDENVIRLDRSVNQTEPAENALLPFQLKDLQNGEAYLQINQRLPWAIVLKILEALKGNA